MEDDVKVVQDSSQRTENSTDHVELPKCCICLSECDSDVYECSGTDEHHFLCFDCGDGYIDSALDREGAFDS